KEKNTPEEVAEGNLMELIHRSVVQALWHRIASLPQEALASNAVANERDAPEDAACS
ncbi:hypothetical protein ACJX0J_022126, partial [Zea mays]